MSDVDRRIHRVLFVPKQREVDFILELPAAKNFVLANKRTARHLMRRNLRPLS